MGKVEKFDELKKRKEFEAQLGDLKYDGYFEVEVFVTSEGKLALTARSSYQNLDDEDFQTFMTAMVARLREINTKPPK